MPSPKLIQRALHGHLLSHLFCAAYVPFRTAMKVWTTHEYYSTQDLLPLISPPAFRFVKERDA